MYKSQRAYWITALSVMLLFAAFAAAFALERTWSKPLPHSAIGTGGSQKTGLSAGLPITKTESQPDASSVPTETVDVAIVGSELEGMYLARAAADEGLKVKIIDPREQPGGQLLQAEMLFLDEPKDASGKSLIQGRVKPLINGYKSGKIRKRSEFSAYFDQLRTGIPLESGITIEGVETKPGAGGSIEPTVDSVLYSSANHGTVRLKASYWVENTDFAALVSKLDAKRLLGLEAFYGQDHIEYMGAGYMMKFKNVDWTKMSKTVNAMPPAEKAKAFGGGTFVTDSYIVGMGGLASRYTPSNDRVFLRGLNGINQRDGEVLVNALLIYTVDPADKKSIQDAVALGQSETKRITDYFRKNIPGWEHAEINGFPSYPYIREYNHYDTDYVLQVSDLLGGRMFDDNVAIAGYPIDLQGTSANKWGIEFGRPDKYGMPLRSFLLKGYDNVIVAGKNVGASALAYGSARIQANTAMANESIGAILGKLQGKKRLKALTPSDWLELHTYLKSKYQLTLTGVTGRNYLAGWTEDELAKLNTGKIIYASYKRKK